MSYSEFLLIAKRLNYRKKEAEEKKKMADISEEQIEGVFNRYKRFH